MEGTLHDIESAEGDGVTGSRANRRLQGPGCGKVCGKNDYPNKEEIALGQEHDLAAKISHAAELRASIAALRADIAATASQFRLEPLDTLEKISHSFFQAHCRLRLPLPPLRALW